MMVQHVRTYKPRDYVSFFSALPGFAGMKGTPSAGHHSENVTGAIA